MAQPLRLTYLTLLGGRAFAIRAALRYGKIDFVDHQVTFKEFKSYVGDASKAPLHRIPTLEVTQPTKAVYTQSTSLARYAGRLSGLYPSSDPHKQLIVDEAMDIANELLDKIGSDKNPDVRKALREKFSNVTLPPYLNLLSSRIGQSGGPFLLGKDISVGDLYVYGSLQLLYSGLYDHIPKDIVATHSPVVHRLYIAVESHPIGKAEIDAQNLKKDV